MRRLVSYLGVVCALLLSISFVSAACLSPSQTIMTLSSQSNAHAWLYNNTFTISPYTTSICYDEIFGTPYNQLNPWQCTGTNKVVSIYSPSNSHVADSSYSLPVCYGDLACHTETGASCTSGKLVLSMSSLSNAHAAKDASYAYKVCCQKGGTPPAPLGIVMANWTSPKTGITLYYSGINEFINLSVQTNGLSNGLIINISVYNQSGALMLGNISAIVNNNNASYSSKVSELNITNNAKIGESIYFVASHYDSSGALSYQLKSNNLTLSIVSAKWLNLSRYEIDEANKNEIVMMYSNTTDLPNRLVNISAYYLNTSGPDIEIWNQRDISTNAEILLSLNISKWYPKIAKKDKFYFTINGSEIFARSDNLLITEITITQGGCCEAINNQTTCNAREPDPNNYQNCLNSNVNPGCTPRTKIKCVWNNNKCNTNVTIINASGAEDGGCYTSYSGIDSECIQGFRKINITILKTPSNSCGAIPLCLDPCESGACTVPCREVALLPFFTTLNAILAVILIAAGYFAIEKGIRKSKKDK